MERLTDHQWRELREGAKVLAADEHGDKVLLGADGKIIKLFRRKRLMSSALWRPYARRFAEASRRLKALGFHAAEVERVFRVPSIRRDAVVYPMVEGVELRARLAERPQDSAALLRQLIGLMSRLHGEGVYFRAIHLGNVLVGDGRAMGLIDLSEAQFFRRPLSPEVRARNFRPLRKYAEDAAVIDRFGAVEFVRRYLDHASMNQQQRGRFLKALQRVDASWVRTP